VGWYPTLCWCALAYKFCNVLSFGFLSIHNASLVCSVIQVCSLQYNIFDQWRTKGGGVFWGSVQPPPHPPKKFLGMSLNLIPKNQVIVNHNLKYIFGSKYFELMKF
jgi:hypothetical protein